MKCKHCGRAIRLSRGTEEDPVYFHRRYAYCANEAAGYFVSSLGTFAEPANDLIAEFGRELARKYGPDHTLIAIGSAR